MHSCTTSYSKWSEIHWYKETGYSSVWSSIPYLPPHKKSSSQFAPNLTSSRCPCPYCVGALVGSAGESRWMVKTRWTGNPWEVNATSTHTTLLMKAWLNLEDINKSGSSSMLTIDVCVCVQRLVIGLASLLLFTAGTRLKYDPDFKGPIRGRSRYQ